MKISNSILTFSCIIGLSISVNAIAQTESLEERVIDLNETKAEEAPVKIQYPIELEITDSRNGKNFNIKLEDPVLVEQRLKSIENIMPMVYNESVKKYIDFFLLQRPSFTQSMMEQKDAFFPIFESILRENEMPEELKYLALLESGLNPKAISRSKAVGLWQFMSFTGKEMGLTINNYVDERMSIEKSTDAACKYLKKLYTKFYDWDLALASYNTGPGKISRTMASTGLRNYWDLHPHIHPDTRAYVPQFIALAYLMNFGQEHGIVPEAKSEVTAVERIINPGYLDLRILAEKSGISLAEIQRLNPQYKTEILPEELVGFEVALPLNEMAYFNNNRNDILAEATRKPIIYTPTPVEKVDTENVVAAVQSVVVQNVDDVVVSSRNPIVLGSKKSSRLIVPELVENREVDAPVRYKNITKEIKKYHHVKQGEGLNKIADRYNVSVSDIKKWNNIRGSKIDLGENLAIYVKKTEKVRSNSIAARSSSESIKKSNTHTVRHGDTLWNISQRYDGVTVNEIKKWNNIKGNSVRVGQRIKLRA